MTNRLQLNPANTENPLISLVCISSTSASDPNRSGTYQQHTAAAFDCRSRPWSVPECRRLNDCTRHGTVRTCFVALLQIRLRSVRRSLSRKALDLLTLIRALVVSKLN